MGYLTMFGSIFACHNLGGMVLRPEVLLTSYNAQDSPYHKEFSDSQCQWCWGKKPFSMPFAFCCVNWQWIYFSLPLNAIKHCVYCADPNWSSPTWIAHVVYTGMTWVCTRRIQGALLRGEWGWPGSDGQLTRQCPQNGTQLDDIFSQFSWIPHSGRRGSQALSCISG